MKTRDFLGASRAVFMEISLICLKHIKLIKLIYIKLNYLSKIFHFGMGEGIYFARTYIVYKYKNAKIFRASRAVFTDISLIYLNQSRKAVNLFALRAMFFI